MEVSSMDPHSKMIFDIKNNNKLYSEKVYTAFKNCNNEKTSYTKCSACIVESLSENESSFSSSSSSNDIKEILSIDNTTKDGGHRVGDKNQGEQIHLGSISPLTLNTHDSRMILMLWPSNDTYDNIARISVFVSSIHGKTFYGQLNLTDDVLKEHFKGLPQDIENDPEKAGQLLYSTIEQDCVISANVQSRQCYQNVKIAVSPPRGGELKEQRILSYGYVNTIRTERSTDADNGNGDKNKGVLKTEDTSNPSTTLPPFTRRRRSDSLGSSSSHNTSIEDDSSSHTSSNHETGDDNDIKPRRKSKKDQEPKRNAVYAYTTVKQLMETRVLNIAFTYTIPPTSSPSSSKSGGNGSDEPSTYTRYFSVEDTYDDKSRDHSIFWMFFSNVHNNVLKPGVFPMNMAYMNKKPISAPGTSTRGPPLQEPPSTTTYNSHSTNSDGMSSTSSSPKKAGVGTRGRGRGTVKKKSVLYDVEEADSTDPNSYRSGTNVHTVRSAINSLPPSGRRTGRNNPPSQDGSLLAVKSSVGPGGVTRQSGSIPKNMSSSSLHSTISIDSEQARDIAHSIFNDQAAIDLALIHDAHANHLYHSSKKSPFMNTSHGDSSELGSMHDAPMAISKGNHHSTIGAISNKDDIPSLSSKQEDTPMLGGIGLREPIRFPTQQRDRNSDPEIHPQMEFTTSTTSASYNQELDQYALQKAVGPDSTKSSLKGVECHETGRDDFATIGYGNSSGDGSHDGQSSNGDSNCSSESGSSPTPLRSSKIGETIEVGKKRGITRTVTAGAKKAKGANPGGNSTSTHANDSDDGDHPRARRSGRRIPLAV